MNSIKKRKIFSILENYMEDSEIIVLTGFRRVGKTCVMQYIYDGISSKNKIFFDLESPVNQRIFTDINYENIKLSLVQHGIDFKQKAHIFLDEIQNIRNLPSVIKYLFDHNNIKFYLTGSSSFYLKNQFAESLSGRKYIFELYPLDFEEFLWFKDVSLSLDVGYDLLIGLYREYLLYGGFPSVVLESSPDKKIRKIDDVLGSYFDLDVTNFANFRNNQNLKDLLFLLSSRVGSKLDITKIAEILGVVRPTIYEYLDFFEQTYLIHRLKPLSGSRDVQIKNIPKMYFNDTGILNRVGQISEGQLFENMVFNQLFTKLHYTGIYSRLYEVMNYYQLKTGAEIDFIIDKKNAFEVKVHGTNYDLKRLVRICNNLKEISEHKIISLNKVKTPNPDIIYPFNI